MYDLGAGLCPPKMGNQYRTAMNGSAILHERNRRKGIFHLSPSSGWHGRGELLTKTVYDTDVKGLEEQKLLLLNTIDRLTKERSVCEHAKALDGFIIKVFADFSNIFQRKIVDPSSE